MASEAGRCCVFAYDPIGPVAAAKAFEAPAAGFPVPFRILVHNAYYLPISFSDSISIVHGVEQVEDDH